jgi:hypothetical protein
MTGGITLENVNTAIQNIDNAAKEEENKKPRTPNHYILQNQLLFLKQLKRQLEREDGLDKMGDFLRKVKIDDGEIKVRREVSCKGDRRFRNDYPDHEFRKNRQTKMIENLGNSTIGAIYYQLLLMYEKLLKEIKGNVVPGDILVAKAAMAGGARKKFDGGAVDDADTDLKENWNNIAQSLGVIYGSFMKLLHDAIGGDAEAEEHSKRIQSFVFDTTYDVVSSATSGSASAFTHALGQIPPFGIVLSMMHMIQTAINVGTKSIGGGMIALDPIMEIFGQVIGSKDKGAENYHELLSNIRRIQEAMNLVSPHSDPSTYVEKECAVEKKVNGDSGSGSGSGSGSVGS